MSLQHQPPCYSRLRVTIFKGSLPAAVSVTITGEPQNETLLFPISPSVEVVTDETRNPFLTVSGVYPSAPANSRIRIESYLDTGIPALITIQREVQGKIIKSGATFRLTEAGILPRSTDQLISLMTLSLNAEVTSPNGNRFVISRIREYQMQFQKFWIGELDEIGTTRQGQR